jgi:hypothetical protein
VIDERKAGGLMQTFGNPDFIRVFAGREHDDMEIGHARD